MGKGGGEGFRIVLWMCWIAQWLVTSIYVALAFITFAKLWQAADIIFIDAKDAYKNKIWRAPQAALLLSGLLLIGFDFMSCITLIKKSINRAGAGFSYGFLVAFCFTLAFFLLLCGIVLDGFKSVVKDVLEVNAAETWSSYSTETYIGTEVFALVCFCTFLLFGIALVVFQGGFAEQLGIKQDLANPYAQLEVTPIAVPAALNGSELPAAPYGQYSEGQYAEGTQIQYGTDGQAYYVSTDAYGNPTYQLAEGYQAGYAAHGTAVAHGYYAAGSAEGEYQGNHQQFTQDLKDHAHADSASATADTAGLLARNTSTPATNFISGYGHAGFQQS